MTIYLVQVDHDLHECPAQPEPHPYSTRRVIIAVTPGRPCLTPVTIHSGATTATIACGRYQPYERQCSNCRTVITYQHTLPGVA